MRSVGIETKDRSPEPSRISLGEESEDGFIEIMGDPGNNFLTEDWKEHAKVSRARWDFAGSLMNEFPILRKAVERIAKIRKR